MVIDMTTTSTTMVMMMTRMTNWLFKCHNGPMTEEHPLNPNLTFQIINSKLEKFQIIFCHEPSKKMSHSVLDSTHTAARNSATKSMRPKFLRLLTPAATTSHTGE
jgi:hypothetical protein